MEAEAKQIVEKKVYEEGRKNYASEGKGNAALALGIVGTALGAGALWGRRGGLFGGSYGTPENVNINANMGGGGQVAPTAFEAYSKGCDEVLALTNEIWGLKVNTQNLMYDHRDMDINEKFQLWKSQVDADFGLYKSTRDSFDALTAKHNADVFALYKGSRDGFDALAGRISELEKKVAVNEAVRPYQDKLLQCHINEAFSAAVNYTDRKTCRAIMGELVLPSTPTVTGYASYNPCACPAATTPAA